MNRHGPSLKNTLEALIQRLGWSKDPPWKGPPTPGPRTAPDFSLSSLQAPVSLSLACFTAQFLMCPHPKVHLAPYIQGRAQIMTPSAQRGLKHRALTARESLREAETPVLDFPPACCSLTPLSHSVTDLRFFPLLHSLGFRSVLTARLSSPGSNVLGQ